MACCCVYNLWLTLGGRTVGKNEAAWTAGPMRFASEFSQAVRGLEETTGTDLTELTEKDLDKRTG